MSMIKFFNKHIGIAKIKCKKFESTFHFRKTNCNVVEKNISNLNVKKSCQQKDILTKNIKLNKDIIFKLISENFNSCIDTGEFASELKWADIAQVHKNKKLKNL